MKKFLILFAVLVSNIALAIESDKIFKIFSDSKKL
jgi:hypothetical protein